MCKLFRWWQPLKTSLTERRWRRIARHVTRQTFLTWLAEQVAKDLLNRKPSSISVEELCVAVVQCPTSDEQHHAERFIERFYFNYPFNYCDEACEQACFNTIEAFRRLVQERLLRLHPHE